MADTGKTEVEMPMDHDSKLGRVAIVIANYNGYEVLMDCIQSILKSNYPNYGIIIIDDCSPRFEKKEIEIDSRIICLVNKKNRGFAETTNRGMTYAIKHGYDYILLLNNDTEIDPYMISKLVSESRSEYVTVPKMFFANPHDVIWYGGGVLDRDSGKAYHVGTEKRGNQIRRRAVSFATGCCMLIPVKHIKNIGLLNTSYYMYYEDVDLSARFLLNHIKILYIPSALLWHKVGFSSGGRSNPRKTYYIQRNHLYFIKTSSYVLDKKTAYKMMLKDTLIDLTNANKKMQDKTAILLAWKDFLTGKTGKAPYFK